jgi:hypothetical protein
MSQLFPFLPPSQGSRITISTGVPKRDWELAHSMVESGAKLGSGAFGIVRRGLLKLPGRENIKVAIKVSLNQSISFAQFEFAFYVLFCRKPR